MAERPFSEYAERNSGPILEILSSEFKNKSHVLEIGSGTGQHAAKFAAELSHLEWQTSDVDENHAGIAAWVEDSVLPNLLAPLSVDVCTARLPKNVYDAVYSSNTSHIMSLEAVKEMFALIGSVLQCGGVFCLYGPFRQNREFNTQSNAAFHESLRSRDPDMGIRHLEELERFGEEHGLIRRRLYAMPANNHLVVWKKD